MIVMKVALRGRVEAVISFYDSATAEVYDEMYTDGSAHVYAPATASITMGAHLLEAQLTPEQLAVLADLPFDPEELAKQLAHNGELADRLAGALLLWKRYLPQERQLAYPEELLEALRSFGIVLVDNEKTYFERTFHEQKEKKQD